MSGRLEAGQISKKSEAPSTGEAVKRSIGFMAGMSTLMLGASMVWVSYNTILLPTLVEMVAPDNKGLVVGIAGFIGTILASATGILTGIITDRNSSRMGRRTPAILMGSLGGLPLILLPALALTRTLQSSLPVLALLIIMLGYWGMQFFTNVGNGAWWPLIVDVVPKNQRGTITGIQGFLNMTGAAAGILAITALNQHGRAALAMLVIGGFFALCGIACSLVIKGKDTPAPPSEKIGLWQAVHNMFRVRTRVAVFFWMVLAFLLAGIGFNSLTFFARYALQVYFPSMNPDAAFRILGGINLGMTMAAAVVAGVISDRVGRKKLLLGGMVLCAVASLGLGLTHNFTIFMLMAALRSAASGPIMSIAPALAGDLAPKDEAGQYMAYNNISSALSGSFASLIFGLILINTDRASFTRLFEVSSVFFLIGAGVFLFKVIGPGLKEGIGRPQEAKPV